MKGAHQYSTFIYFLLFFYPYSSLPRHLPFICTKFDLVGLVSLFTPSFFGFVAMDSFTNASVSSSLQQNYNLELFPTVPAMEQEGEGALSLEWLSIFMEDCLSATTTTLPQNQTCLTNNPPLSQPPNTKPSSNHMNNFPTKTKSKRRKLTLLEDEIIPLLPQTYWLAESELLLPKKDCEEKEKAKNMDEEDEEVQGQARRCAHCMSHKTPQWRAGPLGPKTLCNACGVRFKSGRLLPEYRPAKSPTFVSYKHSNSHKKVMEMRMSINM